MNDPTPEKEILDVYLKKIAENLFFSIESFSLLKSIGENIANIKEAHFENFFIPLQRPLINDIILSLNKIFEEKSDININKIQNFLNSNQKTIRLESNAIDSLAKYKCFDFSALKIKQGTVTHKFEFEDFKAVEKSYQYEAFEQKQFLQLLDKNVTKLYEDYEKDLSALKELRDKNIAHSDKKPIITKTTWDKIDELIEFIREYVDMLSWVFLSAAWSGDNSKSFSLAGAEKTSRSFERLLKSIKSIEERS